MKRVRCPKCDQYITFDETKYEAGQKLIFECPHCRKQFAIKIGLSKLLNKQDTDHAPIQAGKTQYGFLTVIENRFHYKQVIPLQLGNNIIGRYMKGSGINCPIETTDPSIDMTHCILEVTHDKKGQLKYTLRDGPSNTGTFVDNEILGDHEKRILEDGSLFTIGATSIILHTHNDKDE